MPPLLLLQRFGGSSVAIKPTGEAFAWSGFGTTPTGVLANTAGVPTFEGSSDSTAFYPQSIFYCNASSFGTVGIIEGATWAPVTSSSSVTYNSWTGTTQYWTRFRW